MKYLSCVLVSLGILAGSAGAADLVTAHEPPPQPPATKRAVSYDWTGPYIGVFGAVAGGTNRYDVQPGPPDQVVGYTVSDTASGGLFGAQIGYDYRFKRIVVGGLADIAASTYSAEISAVQGIQSLEAKSDLKYLGTVQARLGYAMDNMLFYAHGGFAYGKAKQSITVNGVNQVSLSGRKTGYIVGAGVEYAFTRHLSFETEYSYVDLGRDTIYSNPGRSISVTEDIHFHQIKAALNYRF